MSAAAPPRPARKCCCRCPIVLDLVWERVRSRSCAIFALLFLFGRVYALPFAQSAFTVLSCRDAYRSLQGDPGAIADGLDDASALAVTVLLLILGYPFLLTGNLDYHGFIVHTLGVVLWGAYTLTDLSLDTQYCVRIAVQDEAVRRADGGFIGVDGLPVLFLDLLQIGVWTLGAAAWMTITHSWITEVRSRCGARPAAAPPIPLASPARSVGAEAALATKAARLAWLRDSSRASSLMLYQPLSPQGSPASPSRPSSPTDPAPASGVVVPNPLRTAVALHNAGVVEHADNETATAASSAHSTPEFRRVPTGDYATPLLISAAAAANPATSPTGAPVEATAALAEARAKAAQIHPIPRTTSTRPIRQQAHASALRAPPVSCAGWARACCTALASALGRLSARVNSTYTDLAIVLQIVPLRVLVATSLASIVVVGITSVAIVVPIVFVPKLVSLIQEAFASDNTTMQTAAACPRDPIRVNGTCTPASNTMHLVGLLAVRSAARLLQGRSTPSAGAAGRALQAVSSDNEFAWVAKLPELVTRAGVSAAVIACVACGVVIWITITVYYALNVDYVVSGEQAAAMRHDVGGSHAHSDVLDSARTGTEYNIGKSLAVAISGDYRAAAKRASLRRARRASGLVRASSLPEAGARSPAAAAAPSAPVLRTAYSLDTAPAVPHRATRAERVAAAAAIAPVMPASPSRTRTSAAQPAPSFCTEKLAWIRRVIACQASDAADVNDPDDDVDDALRDVRLDLLKFQFSGAFSYIPFYTINMLLTYVLVWVVSFGIIVAVTLPPLQAAIQAALYTILLSSVLPLILREILLGRILADGTRIRMPRLFMLVDTFYTFTVGAVYGFASAVLRVLLVLVWSIVRSTQLHAPLLAERFETLDPGFATHGAVLKGRYAAGPAPM